MSEASQPGIQPAILNCQGRPITRPIRTHFQFSAPPGKKGKGKNRRLVRHWQRPEKRPASDAIQGHGAVWTDFEVETIKPEVYKPSLPAWKFHVSPARYRVFVAGVRSGKSCLGAAETVRAALGLAGELHWVVAPSFKHLSEPWAEIVRLLNQLTPHGISYVTRTAAKQIWLNNGSVIQFMAADLPNNLRGPTVNGSMWLDEVAFMKEEAFYICRTRIITGPADMWMTTSPNMRNWFFTLCRQMGLSSDQPYGEFETKHNFISHRPTWDFPWASKNDIEGMRRTWPHKKYMQEIGAMFGAPDSQVFPNVRECLDLEPPPKELVGVNVMGLDLAQSQDFTAIVIMDGGGRVHHIDRWTGMPWKQTIERVLRLSEKFGTIIAYDKSHVGSVVGELIDAAGAKTMSINCHDAQLKASMVQSLAVATEQTQIRLPHPNADWTSKEAQILLDEMEQYEQSLTRHGSLSYSAPKGLHDDLVMALCMANWARIRGIMGAGQAVLVTVPRKKWDKIANRAEINRMQKEREAGRPAKLRRPQVNPHRNRYKGKMGWGQSGSLWGR